MFLECLGPLDIRDAQVFALVLGGVGDSGCGVSRCLMWGGV